MSFAYACAVALTSLMALGRLIGLFFIALQRRGWDLRRLADDPWDDPPLVSVLVPARDEERNVHGCLASLLAQDWPRIEIIVADDRSTDRTPEILADLVAQDPRIQVVTIRELPEGWFGKPHALQRAAQVARGDWILTTDADAVHRPESIRLGLSMARARGLDVLSLFPRSRFPSLLSRLIYPHLGAHLLAAGLREERRLRARGALPPREGATLVPATAASGGFMLFTRAAWERLGGMEQVKAELAEDLALARAALGAGLRYAGHPGAAAWSTIMPRTYREIEDAQARNPLYRLEGSWLRALWAAALMFGAGWLPVVVAGAALAFWATEAATLPVWLLFAGVAQHLVASLAQMAARAGTDMAGPSSLLAPVGALVAAVMVLRLFLRQRRNAAVEWKGRSYEAPLSAPRRT